MGNQRRCRLGLRGALRLVGGVGQAGSPMWVPGLAVCPVKAPWRVTSVKTAFGKAEKRPETVESLAASVGVLWRCPTLPQPIGCSTIGAAGLSFQVRNVAGRFPGAVTTTRLFVQHHPPLFVWWGVWVDRGLYSGCGCFAAVCCSPVCVGVV